MILFGLCNTSNTFMHLMNQMMKLFIGSFVVVYLDDILLHNINEMDHLSHIKVALLALKENKLYLNLKKCEWTKIICFNINFEVANSHCSRLRYRLFSLNTTRIALTWLKWSLLFILWMKMSSKCTRDINCFNVLNEALITLIYTHIFSF